MSRRSRTVPFTVLVCLAAILAAPLLAVVEPDGDSSVAARAFKHPDLTIEDAYLPLLELDATAASRAHTDLDRLGVAPQSAYVDLRGGRFETLVPVEPLLPGDGDGNDLSWSDLTRATPEDDDALRLAAWDAFAGYLEAHREALRIDLSELSAARRVTVHSGGDLVQIFVLRAIGGIPVRDSYLSAVISHGNLSLLGLHRWGDVRVATTPALSMDQAQAAGRDYLGDVKAGAWAKPRLLLLPMARGHELSNVAAGEGYSYRLAWSLRPDFEGEHGRWEMLLDAHSGDVLSFEDTNHYAEAKGGVYPVTNDGIVPDGVEQAGWPMPFNNITHSGGTAVTDTGGNIPGGVSGNRTSVLDGPFVRMNDNCGAISLSSTGDLDFGTSAGDDCVTPGFGDAGNTHSSRTGFYELNKLIEMAKGWLPANTWLQQQLTSNMNINNTCNAFWNGATINFYRSGGGCFNTGEIAGVFDHEWGHGMDDNDAVPTIAGPSGEGIADIYTALRLNTSCIGRNFRATNCTGFGDPCLNCTGVRDIDYLMRQSGNPHDYTWSNANCGGSVHCVGAVYAEAVWSLWKRKLQSAPYNYDNNTAHEITNRLSFIGAGNVGTWFSGSPPNGGCGASGGYLQYLAVDDDNGNLNDGTPHMNAIFTAFDDQEIACATPTVQDAGCAGTPTVAPNVTANPLDKSVALSWGAVAGATEYSVFRTEGVFQCEFGKVRLGSTTGTSWTDNGLQNGRPYSYVVIAKGPADACFGPASACDTVTPAAGPNLDVDAGSAVLAIGSGDGDPFLDNCETATMTFDVNNTGIGTLTNVRITGVTPISHPSITVTTGFPAATSPSTLAQGGTGTGSFDFTADGLSFNDTVTFQVDVTADQISPVTKSANLDVIGAESDLQAFASKTYSFEGGTEGWTVIQGTWGRTSSGGGAQGTTWYEASSANLDNQCDQIQSPIISLSATSTMELWNQYDIEPQYTNGVWYDRANVGVSEVATGTRTPVNPSGGRLYNASGAQGTCGTSGQQGWADAQTTWGSSSWNAGALGSAGFAGDLVQLDVRYGTDASLSGFGFHFDQVTLTDFSELAADGQSDSCSAGCTSDAQCDNGDYCDGDETCDIPSGTCQPGTTVVCDDSVACTDDSCNETTDQCDFDAIDANCTDPLFCNGDETCDQVNDCQPGTDPCPGLFCDESGDFCYECNVDADCDDGAFCNGAETCSGGACQAGTDPCPGQSCDEVADQCVAGPSAQLESDCLTVGGSATTVTLAQSYVSPVVTTSVQYDNNTTPVVTRVSNVTQTSFDVRLQNPSSGPVAAENVCYLVVEEGTWTIDGFAVEAQTYTSTVTDDAPSNWVGEAQVYGQSYTTPVVIGQVMSEADPDFTVFWDMATTRANPPSSTDLATGKTVCEDTDVTRADETIGFIVIEAGHGTLGGVEFEAATGADTVAGVTNAPPYAYSFNTPFATAPAVVTVQMAAVDGNNGGWAQVHGATVATTTSLFLSIDEDQVGDTERSHTTEQVAYAAFAGPVVYPAAGCTSDLQCDNGLYCDGAETCDIPSGTCQAGTPPVCDNGDFCDGVETCNESTDSCDPGTPPVCDDGLFCNGTETCNETTDSCDPGTDPCTVGQVCNESTDTCDPIPSVVMEWGTVTAGATAVRVTFSSTFTDPVVVTAVQYDNNTIPVVTRISSLTGTGFGIRLQNAGAGSVASDNVSWLVVEAGVHTVNGVQVEAQSYTSTVTDENNSWVGEPQSLAGSFTNPVVLGQVMSSNDPDWSVFWDQGTTRQNPPIATALTTGKTVCEDTLLPRANETVGFVVIEAGHGTLGGIEFEAALGADSVRGVGNAPPYPYTFSTPFAVAPTVAVTTMAAVDGGNGGWAQVHGPAMASTTTLNLSIDEDTLGDTERAHTPEQVGYVVFAGPGSAQ